LIDMDLRQRTDGEDRDGLRNAADIDCHPEIYEILDSICLPMAILEGAAQTVRYVNPAFCLSMGKNKDEIAGRPFADIFENCEECVALLERAYRTGKSESHMGKEEVKTHPLCWSYQIWPITSGAGKDGGERRLIFQVTETAAFHQRVTAMNEALMVSAVRQDELNTKLQGEIKERKQTQEALMRSERLSTAGRLAASIAHEINNPLEAVVNMLYLARTTPGVPEEVRELLDTADSELMRITHIARQTLGFYRESSPATDISASDLMSSVVDLLQAKIKASGATVEQRCNPELRVVAVSGELRQVLANLLANSLDAVGRDGVVKVRCSSGTQPGTGRSLVRITVADNGKGMDPATLKKIFEPFFTTKGSVGTGLGLWVSKELVEKNGGSIRARSSTSGKRRGTTFSFVLPTAM
jgi:two-component system NtrC family sensor kinase